MKFTKTKPTTEIKPVKRNNHTKAKLGVSGLMLIALIVFFGLFAYLAVEYINTHTFTYQSPIQSPVIIKRIEIISPVSSKSAMLNVAYAEEVENPYDSRSPKGVGWELIKEKWGIQEWGNFEELVMRESGWNPYSVNASSGACGIPQALPCSKMDAERWDYEGQLKWMVNYIQNRYKTPTKALEFHDINGWY
jgi:hypothetical protein